MNAPRHISWTGPTDRDSLLPLGPGALSFPPDLAHWLSKDALLSAVRDSAHRICGDSWSHLLSGTPAAPQVDDLLILLAYSYLRGTYHSIDVIRRLESDPVLDGMSHLLSLRTEQIRRYRRQQRPAITDCLTRTLVAAWRQRHPGAFEPTPADELRRDRVYFRFLEPFYLQAQDRIDRAVVLDSMALDY